MLKKVLKLSSILLAGLIISSCTINKPQEQVRTITVSGSGSVSLKADQLSLKFLVRTSDWNVTKACDKNTTNTNNVINAIIATGINQEDIITTDYRISQDNTKAYPGEYTVYNTICVLVRNTDMTNKVIDAAVKLNTGANGLTGYQYSISDKTTALRQARTLAVQNAQDAASLLAGASGCRVDAVIDIKENDITTTSNSIFNSLENGNFVTPKDEGTYSITSNVTITYSLAN